MDENLCLLADKLGIARCFSDGGVSKQSYTVSEDVIKFFCTQYGFNVRTPEETVSSLKKAENSCWKKTLENIVILR